jgi:hypothetical protein
MEIRRVPPVTGAAVVVAGLVVVVVGVVVAGLLVVVGVELQPAMMNNIATIRITSGRYSFFIPFPFFIFSG